MHDHGEPHSHHHSHAHETTAGQGHNHPDGDHLNSHVHGTSDNERAAELQTLTVSFVDGFRAAADKTSYLRLASIPFQMEGDDGLTLNLVDVAIHSEWQIGTASPAFASRELSYMTFPGDMVQDRETMRFTYVSLTTRRDVDLQTLLHERLPK